MIKPLTIIALAAVAAGVCSNSEAGEFVPYIQAGIANNYQSNEFIGFLEGYDCNANRCYQHDHLAHVEAGLEYQWQNGFLIGVFARHESNPVTNTDWGMNTLGVKARYDFGRW